MEGAIFDTFGDSSLPPIQVGGEQTNKWQINLLYVTFNEQDKLNNFLINFQLFKKLSDSCWFKRSFSFNDRLLSNE